MQELINRITDIIGRLEGYTKDFQFKLEQIEGDTNIISQEVGEGANGSDKEFISSLNAAKNRYRDAIDTLQIAKQRLEEVLMHL